MKNASMSLDLYILLRTMRTMLLRRGGSNDWKNVRYEVVTAGKVPSSGRFIVMKGNSDIADGGLPQRVALFP